MKTILAGKILLCLIFFLACREVAVAEDLAASEYGYRLYTSRDGLPTNMVESMFQDSRGFLWFGTELGAVCFDGHRFKSYLTGKGVIIEKIEEKDNGEIVFYGYISVYILNPKTDEVRLAYTNRELNLEVSNTPGLPPHYILYQIRRTDSLVLYKLQGDTVAPVLRHKRLNEMGYARSLYYDQKAKVFYVPTQNNKLYIIDEQGIERNVLDAEIFRFVENGNELWGVNYDGVYVVTEHSVVQKFRFPARMQNTDGDFRVIPDENRNLIIQDDRGVCRYIDGKFERIIDNISIPRSVFFDREGNLWHTSRQGIYNFFHLGMKSYKIFPKDADIVNGILPAGNNRGYYTTERARILYFDNDNYKEILYPKQKGSSSFSYRPLQMGETLFFPTYDDILKYQNGHFSWLNLKPEIYYTASCVIDKDYFAMGGWETVKIIDKNGKLQRKITFDVLNKGSIYVVETDSAGRLWVGGYGGLACISDTDTLKFLNDYDHTYCFSKDTAGRLWFTRGSAICYVEGDTIREFMNFKSPMINMVFTKTGLIAATDYISIYIIDPGTGEYVHYNHTNGFSAGEPNWLTMTGDDDGNVYLGVQGQYVVKFNPRQLFSHRTKPVFNLTGCEYSKDNSNWLKMNDLEKLKSNGRNIRFSFAGLCFSNPEIVRYRYRLIGFQNEWSEPVKNREITFNNLPPGDYTFEIYADAGTEESCSETRSFTFSIHPAFWQTPWFLILSILSLVFLSSLMSFVFLQRKNRTLLEKFRTEKELNKLHISSIRLKAIPHFNANVLAAIEYYIANRTKEEAMHILGIYSNFTLKTLSDIDKAARPLSEELDYAKMYLDLEKIRFLGKFDFQINVEDGVDKSVQLPNMILHTYCENAVKHGLMPLKSGGRLTIHVSQQGQTVYVNVEDNGVGRDYAARNPHLYSTKQGLSILNRQIEIYNRFNREKIQQQTEDLLSAGHPSGTRFTVKIPLSFTYII